MSGSIDRRSDIVATFLAQLPDDPSAARTMAEGFATGQSLGTWVAVPGITDAMRARYGARLIDLRRAIDERIAGLAVGDAWVMRIGFPIDNLGRSLAMLLTTTIGNDPSTSIPMRLVDVAVPEAYTRRFPGPRFGPAGWRAVTGVEDRPLLLNMIKPCTGFPPEVGAGFVEVSASAGVDLIKDDELLADPPFSEVAQRTAAYVAAIERVAAATGHRARYMAHVTTTPSRMIGAARAAVDAGAAGVMLTPLTAGLDALAELADAGLGVPVFAHTAGIETYTTATSSGVGLAAMARLLRLAGADAILVSSPHARRPLSESVYLATIAAMRDDMSGLRDATPVVGGGITADHVPAIVDAAGMDVIIGVGGAIQGHPDGPIAGGRAVRRAIDDAAATRRPAQLPGPVTS